MRSRMPRNFQKWQNSTERKDRKEKEFPALTFESQISSTDAQLETSANDPLRSARWVYILVQEHETP